MIFENQSRDSVAWLTKEKLSPKNHPPPTKELLAR